MINPLLRQVSGIEYRVCRPDDTPEALAGRLKDYHSKTKPVLGLFRRKELVLDIDGTGSADAIQNEIRERLGS